MPITKILLLRAERVAGRTLLNAEHTELPHIITAYTEDGKFIQIDLFTKKVKDIHNVDLAKEGEQLSPEKGDGGSFRSVITRHMTTEKEAAAKPTAKKATKKTTSTRSKKSSKK